MKNQNQADAKKHHSTTEPMQMSAAESGAEKASERAWEENHLADCIRTIKRNIVSYEEAITKMNADIEEMYEHYRDDDPEIFVELSNTITMNNNMKIALGKNQRALIKPYFGRIDVLEKESEKDALETFYIGKGGVMSSPTEILVVDWRAPIANVYYENGLGDCSFSAPDGTNCTVELLRKRTYEIENERLLDYYDSEVVANDELLTKYLAKNKEAVLGEIIATIQKEQNDIIRKSPYRSMIVQGVAGSGKTTVAMHRISYILYNYEADFKPEDFYIIGSNRILLNYITGVLPDLDVHGVKQMTMEQLFIRLLYEDWNEKKYRIVPCDVKDAEKGSLVRFQALAKFCDRLEDEMISKQSIYLEDEVLYSEEQIAAFIRENPHLSLQSKIGALNVRAMTKLNNAITGREISYDTERQKALKKEIRGHFGGKKWKKSIYRMYEEFLEEWELKKGQASLLNGETLRNGEFVLPIGNDSTERTGGIAEKNCESSEAGLTKLPVNRDARLRKKKGTKTPLDVYDLAALAFLYKRIKETDPIREAHHIVVDEAQDFGMMAYSVLKYCIPQCTWTIMGDVSQNIRFGFGLNDWEELKTLMLTERNDAFAVLSKSYRNTVEISDFAQKILRQGSFSHYPIEPIIRHGSEVRVEKYETKEQILEAAVSKLQAWQQSGYDTIAVVTRHAEEATEVSKLLGSRIDLQESDLEKAEFGKGILVLPVEFTKGLEFDAVLIYEPSKADYPVDDGHAKLLYVAATRALHELTVLVSGDMTELMPEESRNRE